VNADWYMFETLISRFVVRLRLCAEARAVGDFQRSFASRFGSDDLSSVLRPCCLWMWMIVMRFTPLPRFVTLVQYSEDV
jgi:hypothetical protein